MFTLAKEVEDGSTTSLCKNDTIETLSAFIDGYNWSGGILNVEKAEDILFSGKDPMWSGNEVQPGDWKLPNDSQQSGSADVIAYIDKEANIKVVKQEKDETLQKDWKLPDDPQQSGSADVIAYIDKEANIKVAKQEKDETLQKDWKLPDDPQQSGSADVIAYIDKEANIKVAKQEKDETLQKDWKLPDDPQQSGSADVITYIDKEANNKVAKQEKDRQNVGSANGSCMIDEVINYLRDLIDPIVLQSPPEVAAVDKDEIASSSQAGNGEVTRFVLEKNAKNIEQLDSVVRAPARKETKKQVLDLKFKADHISHVQDGDEGFDESIHEPEPSLPRRKRPRPIENTIPSVVMALDPGEEDCVGDFRAQTGPPNNLQTVTFSSCGKAVSFSCTPDATGKDLKQVVKTHRVLEKLGIECIDAYMLYYEGRCFEEEEVVVPNLVLEVVGLPSRSKKRKVDIANIKKGKQ